MKFAGSDSTSTCDSFFLACMFCLPNSDHVMFSWEFAFCLLNNYAYICTWMQVHKTTFERTVLWGIITWSILGDPGAVSRAGRKGATNVFNHRRKSPWVPTLTGPFPNGQANAGSWLGSKNALYYCAQSAASAEFFSWVCTRRLLTRSRLVWLLHQTNARSQESSSLI